MSGDGLPPAVFTLWRAGLAVTLLVLVPLAVYLLHATWRAAHSIQLYARDALTAARGIAGHTRHLPAMNDTIDVGTQILSAAESVDRKLDTIANVLAQRAGG